MLKQAYTLWAPLYDLMLEAPTRAARRRSLALLGDVRQRKIVIAGVGTGLDFPHLRAGAHYTGIDLTPAMLDKARRRARRCGLPIRLIEGDACTLPFADGEADVVVLHLILAVVPNPAEVLAEASRILRPGGQALILDKFLRPGQRAPLRRAASPLLGRLATRTDVVFEPLLEAHPELCLRHDAPAFARGWFRHILLEKTPLQGEPT